MLLTDAERDEIERVAKQANVRCRWHNVIEYAANGKPRRLGFLAELSAPPDPTHFRTPRIFAPFSEQPWAASNGKAHWQPSIPVAQFLGIGRRREEGAFEREVRNLLAAVDHKEGAVLDLATVERLTTIRDALRLQLERCGERLFGLGDFTEPGSLFGLLDPAPLTRLREALAGCLLVAEAVADGEPRRDLHHMVLNSADWGARNGTPFAHEPYLHERTPWAVELCAERTVEDVQLFENLGVPRPAAKATVFSLLHFERLREPIVAPAYRLLPRWQAAEQLLHAALCGEAIRAELIEAPPEPSRATLPDTSGLLRLSGKKHGNDKWGPLLLILKAASYEARRNDEIAIRWGELCDSIPEAKRYCKENGLDPASIDPDRIGKYLRKVDDYL